MTDTFLCKFDDIPEYNSKEFELGEESCFAVRQGHELFIYRNSCPHMGVSLNMMPDQFLDYDNRYIQCTNHGALFEINTGLCVTGPCLGRSLQQLSHRVIDDEVFVSTADLEGAI